MEEGVENEKQSEEIQEDIRIEPDENEEKSKDINKLTSNGTNTTANSINGWAERYIPTSSRSRLSFSKTLHDSAAVGFGLLISIMSKSPKREFTAVLCID